MVPASVVSAPYTVSEPPPLTAPRCSSRVPATGTGVLMITGHWEAPRFSVSTSERPPMDYDYYGFPEHTYRLTYPAPGDPMLAQQVIALLDAAGLAANGDAARGYDHGLFVPFKLIYPNADVPMVQLSLRADLDPLNGLSKDDFALALEHERRVEFYNEGQRWFDLVRTGRAQTVMNNYWAGRGLSFTLLEHELLMPIPAREIGIDPNLEQNPGY